MLRRKKRPRTMLCPMCLDDVIFQERTEKRRNGYERKYLACPACETAVPRMYVEDYRAFPPVVVSAVGFSQHGKTAYFSSLFYVLRHMGLAERWNGFYTQCVNEESLTRVWEGVHQLHAGQLPAANPKVFPVPTMVRLHAFPGVSDCTLIMYDTAGESFNRPTQVIQYARFVCKASSVLFLVSLPRIQQQRDDPDETMHRLLETYIVGMRELGARPRSQNLSVVFTMADAMWDLFGEEWNSLKRLLTAAAPGDEAAPHYVRQADELSRRLYFFVRDKLEARNFLNLAEGFFRSTSFNMVSALGTVPNDQNAMATKLMPRRVFDPLLGVMRGARHGALQGLRLWA